jgi:formiminotetrahydrofolate cyclodeaminase
MEPDDLSGPVRSLTDHIAGQHHAMAGATIALSAALATGLGEACLRIAESEADAAADRATLAATADRLKAIRGDLLSLADEDGAAITAFAADRDAGHEPQGQVRLCRMPVDVGRLAVEAGRLLQAQRALVQRAKDDLEMALRLLDGAARASYLLLDSNLRIWPQADLLAQFEPELAALEALIGRLAPVAHVRS